MKWEKISKGRVRCFRSGFFVIKPEKGNEPVPLFCPLCHTAMKNSQDVQYFRKWGVCYECGTIYAEPNREKWQEGWRPDLLRAGE